MVAVVLPVLLLQAALLLLLAGSGVCEELHYKITEELPAASFVGNVFADSSLERKYGPLDVSQLQFRFLSQPDLDFTIESGTGIIRTGSRIDRDQICPSKTYCLATLDVAAMNSDPAKFFEIIKVTVEIEDINDNWPEFPETKIVHKILESASAGASFVIPTAVDPDSGEFGIQGYHLVPVSGIFRLDVQDKLDGSTDVRLVLRQRLDRETNDHYQVKVVAYDGGVPYKSGTVDVIISVQDANDNDPHFENSTYVVTIPENIPIQSTILIVKAHDRDSGLYGEVTYKFSERSKAQYGHLFGIKNITGEVYVKGVVDFESIPVYHLSVIAQDRGPDSLPADATIIIKVEDVNDHSPVITVNTLAASGTDKAEIAEDSPPNTFVAHLTVVDQDSGINGNFSCGLNDNHFRLENLYQGEYKIVTQAPLDREIRSQYSLAIMCQDRGVEPQISIKHIQISVTDVNDNTPQFTQESYVANMVENNYVGELVVNVNASDRDKGKNAKILYRLHRDAGNNFRIDHVLGTIKANEVFDHEKEDYIRFRVLAVDRGNPSLTGTALVILHINDINDEKPQFSQAYYEFKVPENEVVGTSVGVVTAIDPDDEPHNAVKYSLTPHHMANDYFRIEPHSGLVKTRKSLDRESQPVYFLSIVAQDSGLSPHSSTVTATIFVSDKNDNDPIFDYPTRQNNTVHISSKMPVGSTISRMSAHDLDTGQNSNLTFKIAGGNRQLFGIETRTGIVKVAKSLTSIEYEVFNMVIGVKDQGMPSRGAETSFNIVVNKTIPFILATSSLLSGYSLPLVIGIGVIASVLFLILIIAIAVLRSRDKDRRGHKYNCRMEALRMLQSGEGVKDTEPSSPSKGHSNGNCLASDTHDRPKKEVSFNLEPGGQKNDHQHQQQPQVVSPKRSPKHVDPASSAHAAALQASQSHPRANPSHPASLANSRPWALTQKELEVGARVHQLLDMIKQDQDADSAYSGESSNTDSGRGLSEEGDGAHRVHHDSHNTGAPTAAHPAKSQSENSFSSVEMAMSPSDSQSGVTKHSYSSTPSRLQTFSPGPGGQATSPRGGCSRTPSPRTVSPQAVSPRTASPQSPQSANPQSGERSRSNSKDDFVTLQNQINKGHLPTDAASAHGTEVAYRTLPSHARQQSHGGHGIHAGNPGYSSNAVRTAGQQGQDGTYGYANPRALYTRSPGRTVTASGQHRLYASLTLPNQGSQKKDTIV